MTIIDTPADTLADTLADAATIDAVDFSSLVADRRARGDWRFELFAVDLYRDIHKGIRTELFAATSAAGRVDPDDPAGHADLAGQVAALHEVLESHAHHEDAFVDEPLQAVASGLAERINADHETLEARFAAVADLASEVVASGTADRRRLLHLLYLQLSGFTSAYLHHQLVEERLVMPALAAALTFDEVLAINNGIVASIPPDEMARSLSFMLPAMNADDRAELLRGMREGAPPEVFEGVIGLARSVLEPREYAATLSRLGLR